MQSSKACDRRGCPRLPLTVQLRGLKLVLANGTLLELSPRKDPHLWLAAGVGVGRLGVITEVTLRIKPQQAVRRSLQASSEQSCRRHPACVARPCRIKA